MALPTPVWTQPFTDWDAAVTDWDDPLTNWDQTDPPPPDPDPDPPPPVTGSIWTATLNGVTFGVQPYIWEEDGPDIFGWSGVRSSYTPRPGGDGSISVNPTLGQVRPIDLPVFINLTDEVAALNAQQAAATAWQWATEDQILRVTTPRQVYNLFGRPEKLFSGIKDVNWGIIRIVGQFVATDPLFYSDEREIVGTLTSTVSGLSFPHSFPHSFGQANSGGVTIVNDGNKTTRRVVIVITAGATGLTNPRLEMLTTGDELVFDLALSAGQELWIDFAARTVLLDNTTSRSGSLRRPDSTWWQVPPGSHQIRFTGVGGAAISVKSRSAWIL